MPQAPLTLRAKADHVAQRDAARVMPPPAKVALACRWRLRRMAGTQRQGDSGPLHPHGTAARLQTLHQRSLAAHGDLNLHRGLPGHRVPTVVVRVRISACKRVGRVEAVGLRRSMEHGAMRCCAHNTVTAPARCSGKHAGLPHASTAAMRQVPSRRHSVAQRHLHGQLVAACNRSLPCCARAVVAHRKPGAVAERAEGQVRVQLSTGGR